MLPSPGYFKPGDIYPDIPESTKFLAFYKPDKAPELPNR
jgi:hypothetical protein